MRIVFVLPARAGGGGSHSIIQEAAMMHRMGLGVRVLVNEKNLGSFLVSYPQHLDVRSFVGSFASPVELTELLKGCDVVIGTIFTSMALIREALTKVEKKAWPKIGYYIQDYEPLFTEHGSPLWAEAMASYTVFPVMTGFAKTDWLCDIVGANHGIGMTRVEPSIDHDVYYPVWTERGPKRSFCAMLRPVTPRRAPRRTVRVLNWLAEQYGDRVLIRCFGCEAEAAAKAGLILHPAVEILGHLKREQVAETLRHSDYFLDLSDFQAFGRTGVEAMASGCIPLLPIRGAPPEYVRDGSNGFLVDTANDQAVLDTVRLMADLAVEDIDRMSRSAVETASRFTTLRAALSVIKAVTG